MSMSGSVVVAIKAVDEASSVFGRIQASLGVLGGAIGQLGGPFASVGNIISGFAGAGVLGAVAAASTQVITGLKESIAVFQSFEAAMAKVQTTTGASAEELAQLKDLAVDLSTKFGVSANQVAEALYYMSGGMVDAAAASQAIGPALSLAVAAGLDAKEAAVAISDLGTQFKLFSDDSDATAAALQHVTDTLVFASQNFQVEVNQLISSFKAVGPIASQLGLNLDEVVVTLGILADAGYRADESGTGLRALLMNLASPGKEAAKALEELNVQVFDADGKMLSLTDIIAQFGTAMDGMTQAEQLAFAEMLVGTQHASKLLVLVGAGADTIGDFTEKMQSTASASETVATKMETLEAKQAKANAAWEAASITLGEKLLPVAIGAQEAIANLGLAFADGIDMISAQLEDAGPALSDCGAAFADLSDAIGGSGNIIKDILTAVGTFLKYEIIGWSKIFEFLAKSIQGWIVVFQAIGAALAPVGAAIGAFVGQVQAVVGSIIGALTSAGSAIYSTFSGIYNAVTSIWRGIYSTVSSVVSAIVGFVTGGFNAVRGAVTGAFNAIHGVVSGVLNAVWSRIQSFVNSVKGIFDWLRSLLTGGSIWPEMMEEMQKQTKTGLAEVGKLFEGGLEVGVLKPAAAATIPSPATGGPSTSSITINFTIQGVTDPDEVARQVENRLVEVLSRRSEVTAG